MRNTFVASVPKNVVEHEYYRNWLDNFADGSIIPRLEATKELIINEGLITSVKNLFDGLYEKKWVSGLRMYFAVIGTEENCKTLLILGSSKGRDQNYAIRKARSLLANYNVFNGNISFRN